MKGYKKMSSLSKVLILTVAIILAALGYFITVRNGLIGEEQNVKQAMSNVEVYLQRRNDLIPNLISTVKGYAEHEKGVFDSVVQAREKMMGARTIQETTEADAALTQCLGRLLAVAEAYPELKANENFLSLQDELAGTENRITIARKDFNAAATEFNTHIKMFPKNLVANMIHLSDVPLFAAQKGAEVVPSVNFE